MQNRKAHLVEMSGTGSDAPSEMDAPWGYRPGEAHNALVHEMMSRNQDGHTVELSG